MFDNEYMFGDKSTFGSSQDGQNMPKKGQQEKIFFCSLNKGKFLNRTEYKICISYKKLPIIAS